MFEANEDIASRIYNKVSELKLPYKVKTCPPTASIREVINTFQQTNIGSIVITEKNIPVGIFTERDFISKLAGKNLDLDKEQINTYMTLDPISVKMDDPLIKVLLKMREGKFRHIITVDQSGILENVISVKDMLDFLLDGMELDLDFLLDDAV